MIWLPAFFPHVAGVVVTVKMAKAYPQYQVHLIIIYITIILIILTIINTTTIIITIVMVSSMMIL